VALTAGQQNGFLSTLNLLYEGRSGRMKRAYGASLESR